MDKKCRRCGDWFNAKYHYSTYCYSCYRARRELIEWFDDGDISINAWMRLKQQNRDMSRELGQTLTNQCRQPGIPATMLRRLIQLAHPDKHNGSEVSQAATRWLLEQREARH